MVSLKKDNKIVRNNLYVRKHSIRNEQKSSKDNEDTSILGSEEFNELLRGWAICPIVAFVAGCILKIIGILN